MAFPEAKVIASQGMILVFLVQGYLVHKVTDNRINQRNISASLNRQFVILFKTGA